MITMNDWLILKRKGIDLFNLSDENLLKVFSELHYPLEEFAQVLSVFFAGTDDIKPQENSSEADPCFFSSDTIYEVIACVDGWRDLTWFECVKIYIAKKESDANNLSQVLCMLHNVNCSKKADMMKPENFNPYALAKKKAEFERLRKEAGLESNDAERLNDFLTKG